MREIKFRAWDKKEKGWCVAFVISNNGEAHSSFGIIDSITDNIKYWKENVVIMQYTGIKDKNGKEIYFDDILKYEDVDQEKGVYYQAEVVRTINNGAGVLIDGVISDLWEDSDVHEFEVIGNVWENPELLAVD